MITFFLEKFCVAGFLFSTIAFNSNCGQTNSQKTPANDTLKVSGCQGKITVKAGSIVEFKLEAVPGSGYQWLLKEPSKLLQLQDAENLKFSSPSTPGGSGHQRLHFKALKTGEEVIRLEYKRTWETESSNSCEVRVEIN